MSDRLQKLKNSRKGAPAVFLKIIQLNKKYQSLLYCCFEGEDNKYYGVRIENFKQKDYEKIIPLKCGGKKEVLRLYEMIEGKTTLSTKTFIYFIDRDFDWQLDHTKKNIYETPCYSVENFYTSNCVFEKILTNELNVERTQDQFDFCKTLFRERQKEFHLGISLLNAWIYCHRKNESPEHKLNLSSFKLENIIKSFTIQKIEFIKYDINYLEKKFKNSLKIDSDDIIEAKKILDSNPQELYRGKFEIIFLRKFLLYLVESINKKESPFQLNKKTKFNINDHNLLSHISHYAKTLDCLKEYIRKST